MRKSFQAKCRLNLNRCTAIGLIALGLLLFLTGCEILNPPENEEEEQGTLVLSFAKAQLFLPKTIEPDIDVQINAYDIYGTGPQGEMFEFIDFSESSVFQVGLVPGQWDLMVFAKNLEGTIIGSGESVSVVAAGEVTTATITILPLEGQGQLTVEVSWPDSVLTGPGLTGNLNPVDGVSESMDFQMAPNTLSADYEDSLASGYYQMTLQLWDNSDLVWGTVDAVRILAGNVSEQTYLLQQELNRSGFGLVLVDSLNNPINITFSGVVDSLPAGQEMTITAETEEESVTYQWYLLGEPLAGETGESITIGSALDPGMYWLDLLMQKGSVLSSGRVIFQVYATDDTYAQIGPLVITEIMANPAAVGDGEGEWFEIMNVDSVAVDISGWEIADDDGIEHVFTESVVIEPDEVLVFCTSAIDTINGGIESAYECSGLSFTNSNDEIFLINAEGGVVDMVRWDDSNVLPMDAGQSAELIDPLKDNRWSVNWEAATTTYGDGDFGTPGVVN